MCISNKIGPPVEGDDFFGREKEIQKANKLLDSSHSLLLSAPRRIGKSSLAKRLIEEKKNQGWKCVYIDLEETTTEDGFLNLVIEAFCKNGIWKQVAEGMSKGLASVLESIEKISLGPVQFNFAKKEDQEDLYKNLKELIRHDEDTFIVVDELTLYLTILSKGEDGVEKVAFILNWLRSLRQVSRTKVRWLFCGSVGLRNFTSAMNLGYTVNDLTEFSLDELSRDEAAGLLTELCKSENIEMSDELVEYTLNKLYWNIPYFIQIIFSNLAEDYEGKITQEDIDAAYRKLCSENYLSTWSERLVEYGEYELPARQILKLLATLPEGIEREGMLNNLMTGQDASKIEAVDYTLSKVLAMLENDGYIMKKDALRMFRSPLLRDYWFDRFVQ
ncbi:AAA family ATPase [Bacteroides vulgatus]|uniref:AAA family ATPase n=2 Tax=Bacteroidaceae TaxID=815 RepID=A0A7K0JJC9_PHOVU|nr:MULTISPECIES: AAA family ATPase [Bacteroidaceae]MSS50134.1 AAA family ATPase [Phocaeicola vulgatus]NME86879.1 AAA family ATPase [Bacteroides eggerthii]